MKIFEEVSSVDVYAVETSQSGGMWMAVAVRFVREDVLEYLRPERVEFFDVVFNRAGELVYTNGYKPEEYIRQFSAKEINALIRALERAEIKSPTLRGSLSQEEIKKILRR